MSLPPRLLPSSLAAIGAAALMAAPTPAHAQEGGSVAISAGLSFNVSFGQKTNFGLGFDLRVTGLVEGGRTMPCDSKSRMGFGGYAQATWLNFSAWRFGAGGHGGGEIVDQIFALDGELGWTYHTSYDDQHPGEHGLQVGALGLVTLAYVAPSIEFPLRGVFPLGSPEFKPELITGVGARFPAVFGFPQACVSGRPLRAGDDILLPPVVAHGRRPYRDTGIDDATRAALVGAWLDDARAECASVPAFVALARDLRAAGAPSELVARALDAADDELRHTLLCSGIAADHTGVDAVPLLLAPPPAVDADRRDALLRMAQEAWIDGCLGEGAAASRAARALAASRDETCRSALATIARDEARHAELGWSVLAHAMAAGGSEVRDAIAEALDAPLPELPRGDVERDADPRVLRAHGRLAQATADAAWIDTVARARRRATRLLAAT